MEQIGVLQYLPEFQTNENSAMHPGLLAWRQWSGADGRVCVSLDYPQQQLLTDTQAQELFAHMAERHRKTAIAIEPAREIAATPNTKIMLPLHEFPPVRTAQGLPTASSECAARKPIVEQKFWRFAGRDLSFAARLTPKNCTKATDFAGAGTAFMIAPSLAFTAAHILTNGQSSIDCRYRLVPAGGSYNHGEPQPYGAVDVGEITLSPQASFWMRQPVNELSDANLRRYVASDYAFLALKSNALADVPVLWPAVIFGAKARGKPVYKTGYPGETIARALRPPGASLSADGVDACAVSDELNAFSLLSFYGDSGGPIWLHPEQQEQRWLSVISLVSVIQRNHESAAYTYSPQFSLPLYRQFLAYLRPIDN